MFLTNPVRGVGGVNIPRKINKCPGGGGGLVHRFVLRVGGL